MTAYTNSDPIYGGGDIPRYSHLAQMPIFLRFASLDVRKEFISKCGKDSQGASPSQVERFCL